MDLLSLLLIAGISTNQIYVEDTYSENIEYCANIIYNPNLEQEFYANCNLEQVNSYIIDTKRNGY